MMTKLMNVLNVLMAFSMMVLLFQTVTNFVRIQQHKKELSQLEAVPSMLLQLVTLQQHGISLNMERNMKKTSRVAPLSPWKKTKMNAHHIFKMALHITTAARPAQVFFQRLLFPSVNTR